MKSIPQHVFREYDVRGVAFKDLTPDFAFLLGQTYGRWLQEKRKTPRVAVGEDCRLSSPELSKKLREGFQSVGAEVVYLGTCPTPLTYFAVHHFNLDGGIMVTGSHNPPEYNGFKICFGKDTLHGEQIQVLKEKMEAFQYAPCEPAATETIAIIPQYISYLKERFPNLPRLKIVLDAGNGTAATVAPPLFETLGAEIIPLFCELDGRFPNHHPDPTVPANLTDLVRAVREEGADLGVAFDGDSDRIGVVDETGRILFGDELLILFARSVLAQNPGATIISEVKSSHRLYQDIANHGGKPLMWKTGHSLIKAKMKETGALLAGEMSGHMFFADRFFGFDDALYAAVRIYEILGKANKPLSSLLQDVPAVVSTPEIRVDCQEEKKFSLVQDAVGFLPKHLPTNTIDGIRVDFGQGWGLIRASNTQPVLVLRFEAENVGLLKEYQTTLLGALNDSCTKAGHPKIAWSALENHK